MAFSAGILNTVEYLTILNLMFTVKLSSDAIDIGSTMSSEFQIKNTVALVSFNPVIGYTCTSQCCFLKNRVM